MSADNWAYCPECSKKVDAENQTRINAPGQNYGKVSQAEYLKLVDESKNLIKYDETLREDYQIGIYNWKFTVEYRAYCNVCGFEFSFKHEEPAKKKKQERRS